MEIGNNFEEDEVSSDIADDEFMDIEINFEAILDEESSDEDRALSDDSDCVSNCSEDNTEVVDKIISPSEINALNERTKQCTIYFYYTDGARYVTCSSCMIRVRSPRATYAIRKHVIESYDAIDGRFCSKCRTPLFLIFLCNMCPICTQ